VTKPMDASFMDDDTKFALAMVGELSQQLDNRIGEIELNR
jgi:hypothetical protein